MQLAKIPSGFNDKTVTVTIPVERGDIFDIGHVGLWCVRATQDFGHLDIPPNLNVPPYDDKSEVPVDPSATTYEPDVVSSAWAGCGGYSSIQRILRGRAANMASKISIWVCE